MKNKKFSIQEIMSRSFDVINLPSEGKFYESGTKSLNIRHITGLEERVLSSYFLNENEEGIKFVLEHLILDEFDINDFVLSDLQGIMVYLYATAFGDKIKMKVRCSHCGYEDDEVSIALSSLKFKEQEIIPVDNRFYFYIPYEKTFDNIIKGVTEQNGERYVEFELRPPTLKDQVEMKNNGFDPNKSTNKIVLSIYSIGGNENKKEIAQFIQKLNLRSFKKIKEIIQKNEFGIEDKTKIHCASCHQENTISLNLGYDFLKLPETHRQNVLEECFLISHYNHGGMNFDRAMELPTTERRWMINRIQEEMQKKKEAEERAYNASKSKKK
jgi:hypothetical protein